MIVCSLDDRFSLTLDGVEFIFGPMSKRQKLDVVRSGNLEAGEVTNRLDMGIKSLQYSLKEVKGVKKKNGEDFVLEFENGLVSEKSIDAIINSQHSDTLMVAAMEFIVGVPEKIRNFGGKDLEYVELKYMGECSPVKKNNT